MAARRRRAPSGADPVHVDGVLVRVVVPGGPWAETIAPVPASAVVTVSFASSTVADEHRDALELLGYRVVDVPNVPDVPISQVADFLLTSEVIEAHPTYWRSIAAGAARLYHLALGPAAYAVAPIVAAHAPALRAECHAL